MLLDFIQKLLGSKSNSLDFNKKLLNSKPQFIKKNINYITPTISVNNDNIIHNENATKEEIEALYEEIRILQAKNKEKIEKNRYSYNLR